MAVNKTTLDELKHGAAPPAVAGSELSIFSEAGSKLMWNMARAYSTSTITPREYQGQESNCFIALDMARRLNINPLTVMQQLYIVHGRPAWSAQFLIGMFNSNPAFSPLRFEFEGKQGADSWGCRAMAIEKETGELLKGTLITIGMAKSEGWYEKNGSKWKTMPEQMLRYRAASWFIRTYAPEQGMGLMTRDEVIEMDQDDDGTYRMTTADIAGQVETPVLDEEQGSPDDPVEPGVEDEPEAPYTPAPSTVPCPNKNDQPVDEMDCAGCKSREGCPSWT